MKNKKIEGITLIALVITIIVLLILAGVSIATLIGENGILTKATIAKEETKKMTAEEKIELEVLGSFDDSGKLSMNELKENLKQHLNISYSDITTNEDESLTVKFEGYVFEISKEGNVSQKESYENTDKPTANGGWNEDKKVNSPNLIDNELIACYWDESGNEVTADTGENWYQYVEGDNQTDTKTSKWANAKTKDGSYWVWIPRYEYKILSGEGTHAAGKIEVKFIPTSQTKADEGYKIHPAFTNGTSNQYKNGEWDRELPGIWVAKYEMSMETNGVATETSSSTIGDVEISDTIKMVSKPNVSSWRNITIGKSYLNAFNYDRKKESHMMKNSEWGAVAYLAHSQYGRNRHEITINNSNSCITGNAGNSVSSNDAGGVTNAYNTERGGLASTTGNIYGIYDLSGGAYEMVAGYITNGNSMLSYGATMVAKTTADEQGYQTLSTKYATVYPYNRTNDRSESNYTIYKNLGYGYGDAILETSASGSGATSWYDDYSSLPATGEPFVFRGGSYISTSSAGVFYFRNYNGSCYHDFSFRVVLVGT